MKPKPGDPNYRDSGEDFRYYIDVVLIREGRPRYWEFHCAHCGNKVCDLDGTLVQERDISNNMEGGNNPLVRVKCLGRPPIFCRYWYSFTLH